MKRRRAVVAAAQAVVLVTLSSGVAAATLTVDPAVQPAYAECKAKIQSAGFGGVLGSLETSGNGNKISPTTGESSVYPTDPIAVGVGTSSGATMQWDPKAGSELEPGVSQDPCATLLHESFHMKEINDGNYKTGNCLYTKDGVQYDSGIQIKEVRAVYVENAYRHARGLPPRTEYMGKKLPPDGLPCDDKKKEPAGKPKGGCNPGLIGSIGDPAACGGSNGDPHLRTFDGRNYDLMAAGEFTLVASPVGNLRVQARQTAFPGSRTVTLDTAAAADVNGDRIGVYLLDGAMVVRINGTATQLASSSKLPRGGAVGPGPDGTVWVAWPDGAQLQVRPVGQWGISLDVGLPDAYRGKVRGLLGDFDGDDANDLVLPNGETTDELYPTYADSWRITQDESLFDYEPGQSTNTFTDRSLPEGDVNMAHLPNGPTAEAVCRQAGVTTAPILANCITDVALTGQPAFAADAATTQRIVEAATFASPSTGPVPSSGPLRDGSVVNGAIAQPGQAVTYALDLGAATEFSVADWHGPGAACDQAFVVSVDGVSGGNPPCAGQHVDFQLPSAAGPYTLRVASRSNATGAYSFTLVTAKPRTRSVAPGETVDGDLDVPGRRDRYELPTGLTSITLRSSTGCDLAATAEIDDLTDNTVVVAGNPLCAGELGPYQLPDAAHRYAVTISSSALRTGPYQVIIG